MVSPHKIKYNNTFSTALTTDLLVCVAFDGDSGEVGSYLNREAVAGETYDGRYRRVHSYKYNEFFSPKFTFVKKDFGDFTMSEVREMLKWLTSTSQPTLLDVYYEHEDDNVTADWSAIGGWTEISTYKIGNNRTVGITAMFEAVTPYAIKIQTLDPMIISDPANNKITIEVDTDEPQAPVYPRVKITHRGTVVKIPTGTVYNALSDMVPNTVYDNGTNYYWKSEERTSSAIKPTYNWEIVLVNSADAVKWEKNKIYYDQTMYYWVEPYYFHAQSHAEGYELTTTSVRIRNKNTDFLTQNSEYTSTTTVKNNNSSEVIIIDGVNKIISSPNSVNRIFGDDFNWQWLELWDGKNEITIEGNCTIEISWVEPYKVGEW